MSVKEIKKDDPNPPEETPGSMLYKIVITTEKFRPELGIEPEPPKEEDTKDQA